MFVFRLLNADDKIKLDMRKLTFIFSLILASLLASCTGDRGPMGPEGMPGINILGQVFETTVNFNANNNYSNLITFPNNVEVFEADAVMVYLLEEVTNNDIDIWTPLPQIYFTNDGTMLYSFNHTFFDVNIFLDADFPREYLDPVFTQNQTFRIAIVPSEFAQEGPIPMEMLEQSSDINWIQ